MAAFKLLSSAIDVCACASASAGASFSPSPTIEPFGPRLQAPRRVRPFHGASALCRSMSFSLRAINRYVGNLPPDAGVFPDYPAALVLRPTHDAALLR